MENITIEEGGITFTVEFITGHPYRRCHLGKHWPKTTQCIIKSNGLIIGVGEVVKHAKDTDNEKYAKIYSAKKAFSSAERGIWKSVRERLWSKILNNG